MYLRHFPVNETMANHCFYLVFKFELKITGDKMKFCLFLLYVWLISACHVLDVRMVRIRHGCLWNRQVDKGGMSMFYYHRVHCCNNPMLCFRRDLKATH